MTALDVDALLDALRRAAALADCGQHAESRRIVDVVVETIVGQPP